MNSTLGHPATCGGQFFVSFGFAHRGTAGFLMMAAGGVSMISAIVLPHAHLGIGRLMALMDLVSCAVRLHFSQR